MTATAPTTTEVELVNDILGTRTLLRSPRALPDLLRDLRALAESDRPDCEMLGLVVYLRADILRVRLYATAAEDGVREAMEDLAAMTQALRALSQ